MLEEHLLRAQKMEAVGRLSAGVAHDFNNMLTVIRGYTELLREHLQDQPAMLRSVLEIDASAGQAATLTRQLLAFSRQQVTETRVVDLNELVSGLQKMLHRLIGEDVDLRTTLKAKDAMVRADPGQIENLLVNLVLNARDAMPGGGRLTIGTQAVVVAAGDEATAMGMQPGEWVRLSVADSGTGMSDAVKARAFEPFFTTKEQGKGTGLGLSTCYGIVRQHHGHIWIDSAPGRGTTIRVDLPRSRELPSIGDAGAEAEAPRGGETVLLAEDDGGVRGFATRVLRGLGYAVLETSSGREALTTADPGLGHRIDLLLTDVVMPGISGLELRDQLRSRQAGVRTLFISGYNEVRGLPSGDVDAGSAILRKPFTRLELARKVREVLDA
jgi:CheY-like chemotaxis protein